MEISVPPSKMELLNGGVVGFKSSVLTCRVPCDRGYIAERSYALYQAREILQDMLNDSRKKV